MTSRRFGTEESGVDGGGLFKEFLIKYVSSNRFGKGYER